MTAALEEDLARLASYTEPGRGVTRLPWTDTYAEACRWLGGRMREAGLEVSCDAAGNLIGKLEAGLGDGRGAVAIGSHIDTVPNGGRYDGALGVLAGVAVAQMLMPEQARLARPVWVIAFVDEEGARFGTSFFGSRAFAGEELPSLERTDANGVSLADAMAAAGRPPHNIAEASAVDALSAYLELHIEQGPLLDEAGHDVGLVTAIVGRRVLRVRAEGVAAHPGTTPRAGRKDALQALIELAAELHREYDVHDRCSMNIGRIDAQPGVVNVVPGSASMDVELRSPSAAVLDEADESLRRRVAGTAEVMEMAVYCERLEVVEPVACDRRLVDLLRRSAEREDASAIELISGAGHDAMVMARHVPAAMVLVPSRGGISHAPEEHTDIRHCTLGTRVLASAVRELALRQDGAAA